MTVGKYLRWKDEQGNAFRPVSFTGTELLNDRTLNKSTAFTYEEREAFQLNGLLPPRVQTFEDQLNRVYDGFRSASTDIEKYLFLRALQDRNETLFYALLSRHVEEMTPIIYTQRWARRVRSLATVIKKLEVFTLPKIMSVRWERWLVIFLVKRSKLLL